MKIFATGLVGAVLMLSLGGDAMAQCACGPDFCPDDERVSGALASKKQELRDAGYPDRLVTLIDRGTQCFAKIDRGPDVFTMWIVDADGDKQTVPWSAEDEDRAKKQILDGQLKRYWIFNARHAFACCGEPSYDERDDYDGEDGVSASQAIKCTKSGGSVACTN